jgi:DNA-binding transcriptional regulator LsrR (DeoR family)
LQDASLLYRIAQYYYTYNFSQEEISRRENISRPQISRLLKRAREMGIVKIEISLPGRMEKLELQETLKSILKLENVIISPSDPNANENDTLLYALAANYLCSIMGQYKKVGIGWGKTLYLTSLQIPCQDEYKELTFYPAIGNSGTDNPYLQTNSICDRFAERFCAKAYFNNSLAVASKSNLSNISLERWDYLKNLWKNLELLVISLGGNIHPKTLYIEEIPSGTFSPHILEKISGDILGTFILNDQSELHFPEDYQLVAMNLKDLKRTKNVVCIAHGVPKVDIIIFAAANGYIKTLVTDSNTAIEIIEKLREI